MILVGKIAVGFKVADAHIKLSGAISTGGSRQCEIIETDPIVINTNIADIFYSNFNKVINGISTGQLALWGISINSTVKVTRKLAGD